MRSITAVVALFLALCALCVESLAGPGTQVVYFGDMIGTMPFSPPRTLCYFHLEDPTGTNRTAYSKGDVCGYSSNLAGQWHLYVSFFDSGQGKTRYAIGDVYVPNTSPNIVQYPVTMTECAAGDPGCSQSGK